MTRLIDADAIPWDVEGVGEIPVITKEEIDQMPTVDAVPVIRCKDCRHFEADLDEMTMYCANEIMPTVFVCTGQGYCSEAERKEE